MHDLPLLLNIGLALAYALVGGIVAHRVGLPPIVGYLVAGAAIGPFTPGFVGNQATIGELAELGVVFLMFGVGLHFSLRDLWSVRTTAVPGAVVQMVVATGAGFLLARSWGWSSAASLLLGLAISVASTVVLLRALMDYGALGSTHGRVAVGWLVLEDLATVAILVVVPLFAGPSSSSGWTPMLVALLKTGAFIALMLLVGTRAVPWLLRRVVRLESREMFVLVALCIALGTALASAQWFGVSLALGAFIAGVVVSDSPYSFQVNAELLPFRDTFAVLFFVSVGMLVNPGYLVEHWREVLALSALIVVGKALIGAFICFALPLPARTGLVVGAGLSQVGEFSFIVGQSGMGLGLISSTQYSLILACAIVSITVNPFMFRLVAPIERWLQDRPRLWNLIERDSTSVGVPEARGLHDHVVIVGAGRVGHHLAEILETLGVPLLVVESDWSRVETLSSRSGMHTLYGDAANSTILQHADLRDARLLVITVPDEAVAAIVVAAARGLAPTLPIVVRAATGDGARHLRRLGADALVRPEFEGGLQILRSALTGLGYPTRRIQAFVDQIRERELQAGQVDEFAFARKLAAADLDLEWLVVSHGSELTAQTLGEARFRERTGVSLVATERDGSLIGTPGPDLRLQVGDRVAAIGNPDQLAAAAAIFSPASDGRVAVSEITSG